MSWVSEWRIPLTQHLWSSPTQRLSRRVSRRRSRLPSLPRRGRGANSPNAPMTMGVRHLGALFALFAIGCTYPKPPAKLPPPPYIAVLSGQMPPPIDQVARHSWIVVQPALGPPSRHEYGGGGGADPFEDFAAF